jgi:hypothetical protein
MPWLRHLALFALEERARALVHEIAHIVGGPPRGPYDFGQDAMLQELVALKRRSVMDLLRMRPPPEALLFYQAVASWGTICGH